MTCSIDGCDRPKKTRGMCGAHAERARVGAPMGRPVGAPKPMRVCDIDGCDRRHRAYGLCQFHLLRARSGVASDAPLRTQPDRFAERIKLVESGCWEWQAGTNSASYGWYRDQYAHRVSYERHVGPIPEGLVIDHLCRNPICVNPSHLEAVPQRINILRGMTPAAIAVRTNRCGRGHEYTPENTIIRASGGRDCRECRRARRQSVAS